jgi:hypothetical protein
MDGAKKTKNKELPDDCRTSRREYEVKIWH